MKQECLPLKGGNITEIWSGTRTTTGNMTVQDFSDADLLIFENGIVVNNNHSSFFTVVPVNVFKLIGCTYIGGAILEENGSSRSYIGDTWAINYVNDTTINIQQQFHSGWGQTGTIFSIQKVKL